MSDIGPFDKVSFNTNASIANAAGDTLIKSGTDSQTGHILKLGLDGALTLDGNTLASESYVQDALNGYTPVGVATESYVDNKVGDAVAGLASTAYVDQKVMDAAGASVPWIVPTLQNGWANYINSTNGASIGYRLKNGRVELRGIVSGGSKNQVIFTLPPAYRVKEPNQYKQIQLAIAATEKFAQLLIKSTGEVVVNAHDAATLTWVSLNGVSFPID